MLYIVYNGFWNPAPPDTPRRLYEAAASAGMSATLTPNTDWIAAYDGTGVTVSGRAGVLSPADTVLFFDKDTRLAYAMEAVGARLYNRARGIELCDDKLKTHAALARAGIPQPKTLAAPMAYVTPNEAGCEVLFSKAADLGYPLVVKECYGSLGGQVYLSNNETELRALALNMGAKPFLVQEFIKESAGNDKRLYVVGDRVVAAMRRHSDGDFRANIENGGTGVAYSPTAEETALAVRCCRVLGLDMGGVDLLDSAAGTLLCEVNSNAHMAGITACTGVDVAAAIVAYVKEKSHG